jgi:hypothetical protein
VFNHEEKLYISSSRVLMQLLDMLKLKHLYAPVISSLKFGSFAEEAAKEELDKRVISCAKGSEKNKLSAREITINRFIENYGSGDLSDTTLSSDSPLNENSNLIYKLLERDIYLSTPRFVKYLTDVSSDLLTTNNKVEKLRGELTKLNEKLPANIYIPFVTDRIINYVVLKISIKETKVFVTKDKAPYLIAVEVFDPLEIAYDPLLGTILGRSPTAKLPAPKVPKKIKRETDRKLLISSEEAEQEDAYKKLELRLSVHFNPKLQEKARKIDTAITINKTKLAKHICGLFIL